MADVLRAKKDAKGETVEKVATRQQPRDRTHAKTCPALQVFGNVLLLRNVVASIATMLLHLLTGIKIFLACMLFPEGGHFVPHRGPDANFFGRVVEAFNGLIPTVIPGGFRQSRTSRSVRHVAKTGMIRLQVSASVQSAVCNEIEFGNVTGKPVNLFFIENQQFVGEGTQCIEQSGDVGVFRRAFQVDKEIKAFPTPSSGLNGSTLNATNVHIVLEDDGQAQGR